MRNGKPQAYRHVLRRSRFDYGKRLRIISPESSVTTDMYRRSPFLVWLGLSKHFARNRRRVTSSKSYIVEEIGDWIF